jgi:hypothetical protein
MSPERHRAHPQREGGARKTFRERLKVGRRELRRTHVADVIGWNVKPWIAIVGLLHKPHDARQLSGVSNPASEA